MGNALDRALRSGSGLHAKDEFVPGRSPEANKLQEKEFKVTEQKEKMQPISIYADSKATSYGTGPSPAAPGGFQTTREGKLQHQSMLGGTYCNQAHFSYTAPSQATRVIRQSSGGVLRQSSVVRS